MKTFKMFFVSCFVVIVSFLLVSKTFAAEKDMLLVFDASGSMDEQLGGIPRIDALKTAVGDLMTSLDQAILVGLRPFANIKKSDQAEACKLTSLVQNFTTERSIIKTQTSLLQAVGSYTPLAYTLTVSAGDFTVGNDNVLVLLTDGKDTCGGDPVKAAGDLFNSAKKIKVYVIGIGVDSNTKAQLSSIAHSGGGVYYDASNSSTLASSLKSIQTLEQPKVRLESITPTAGQPRVGGDDFARAEILLNNTEYRLQDSLAPNQKAFFKFPVTYSDYAKYFKGGKNITITFTMFGDRRGVSYDPASNSFEESNLHNYRMEFLANDSFPSLSPIEVRGANMVKKSFVVNAEDCAGGKDKPFCYIVIGSNDFAISKYDTFKIEITPTAALTPSASLGTSADLNKDNQTTVNEPVQEKASSSTTSGSTNILIYILIAVVVIFAGITSVLAIILLKNKKNTVDNKDVMPPPTI